ncbi:MAG: VOC family protein [Thermoanaerobaculia bacterium]
MSQEHPGLTDPLDRRQFLARLSATAALLSGHAAVPGEADSETAPPLPAVGAKHGPRILELRLDTAAPLREMVDFYGEILELPVRHESGDRVVITAGATEIIFSAVSGSGAPPFYHFAFNIPENKILDARSWQLKRSSLFLTPHHLRDPAFPDDVRHFRNWNAHSVFFWDPAGNVVEYIARHDLANSARGPFSSRDILYASEIAFVVDDVPATASDLEATFSLAQYRSSSEVFHASGDERGLLLLFKRGREIGDHLRDRPAPAAVFPTRARIQGAASARYQIPDYPYEIAI